LHRLPHGEILLLSLASTSIGIDYPTQKPFSTIADITIQRHQSLEKSTITSEIFLLLESAERDQATTPFIVVGANSAKLLNPLSRQLCAKS